MLRPISIVAILCLLNPVVFAHEGHGLPTHQHGIVHYLVNPAHVLPILLTVAAGAGLWRLICHARRSQR